LNINDDIAYRKIISCTNVTEIKTIGKCLFKTKCKWETEVKEGHSPPAVSWKLKYKTRKLIESRNGNGAIVVVSVVRVIVIELT
jgi:hypothetical protein